MIKFNTKLCVVYRIFNGKVMKKKFDDYGLLVSGRKLTPKESEIISRELKKRKAKRLKNKEIEKKKAS